jgi:hypothetical protein
LGIDASIAFIALARERSPRATLHVASFVDVRLPERCDAILTTGEVHAAAGLTRAAVCHADRSRGSVGGRMRRL